MSMLTERLERLIEIGSGYKDASEYMKNLSELADQVAQAKNNIRRMSRIFRALSHPTRLRILKLLRVREMCVCEIMAILKSTQPTASHHLNILKSVGLVNERREGKWVFYSIGELEISQELIKLIFENI